MTSRNKPAAAATLPSEPLKHWHLLTAGDVSERLGTTSDAGLTHDEAASRLAKYGPNEVREQTRRSGWRMFIDQFTEFMIVLLLGAAVVAGTIGEPQDSIVILAIVVINAVIGFVQEYRAERALHALKQLAALHARVVRGGAVLTVPAAELVPGDVVMIEAGSVVPADLRLTEAVRLRTEEAALTGESNPTEKQTTALAEADLPIGDRNNMVYNGTIVTYGHGRGLVVGTGMSTELGRIAALLAAAPELRTQLQKRLARFSRQISFIAIGICIIVFMLGVLRGESVSLMLLTSVSLAVAAVPEALPAVVTIALALGAERLVKQNVLIRRLPAVETLGSVTTVCSDKTGTLTQNRMRAETFDVDGEQHYTAPAATRQEPWRSFLWALALSNDANADRQGAIIGDPTEVALYNAARNAGHEKAGLEKRAPRLAELPFDAERKCMTTFHRLADEVGVVAFTKGAPERVLERCAAQLTAAGSIPIDAAALMEKADQMAAAGLRVLGVARRDWPAVPTDLSATVVERALTFVGFVGLIDPPRREAAPAVAECTSAGITPIMITGDHPSTARAIAAQLGIMEANNDRVLTGRELAPLTAAELAAQAGNIRVYARVDPEQKIKIVQALQSRGEIVAMTGDGVNDAPALKSADIGIAMGKIGTDVAREASDMVLLDDNFASIVAAVREGRRIYENIRKFVKFVLAGNTGEILTLLLAPLFGLPIPLQPIHILCINLVTDGLPGLALAVEPAEKGIMLRPPRDPGESIFARGLGLQILWIGFFIGGLGICTEVWAVTNQSPHLQTMVFTVLTFAQLFQIMAIRTERESLIHSGITSNLPLLGAVLLGGVCQIAIIYVPILNDIMKTQPLTAAELAFCILLSSIVFLAIELEKWLTRRGLIYRGSAASDPATNR